MDEKNAIKVLIATAEHDITGYLYAPNASEMDSKKKKAVLLGAINGQNRFITLWDCTVTLRDDVNYIPENFEFYNINLSIIHFCTTVSK